MFRDTPGIGDTRSCGVETASTEPTHAVTTINVRSEIAELIVAIGDAFVFSPSFFGFLGSETKTTVSFFFFSTEAFPINEKE